MNISKKKVLTLLAAMFMTPHSMAGVTTESFLGITLNSEDVFDSDSANLEFTTTEIEAELGTSIIFSPAWQLDISATLETLTERAESKVGSGNSISFESGYIYIDTLAATYTSDQQWGVTFGRMEIDYGPALGLGGLWSTDFVEDLELIEKAGVAAVYPFGNHQISASIFRTDTSFLSETFLTHREKVERSDGGTANTNGFKSWTLGLEGELGSPEWGYHLAYRSLSKGDSDTGASFDDETGGLLGLSYDWSSDSIAWSALSEISQVDNFEGQKDSDRRYVTLALSGERVDGIFGTLSYTARSVEPAAGAHYRDRLFQLSAGRDFENGWVLEAGFRYGKENSIDTKTIGLNLSYNIEF